ncbi:MAG: hypothetical protein ACK5M3_13595 [Dysgonomonas sp.]
MRKASVIFIILILSVYNFSAFSQKIDVDINQRPINELFNTIEHLSGYRIYCIPQQMDTLIVSVHAVQMAPAEILRKALL